MHLGQREGRSPLSVPEANGRVGKGMLDIGHAGHRT